MARSNLLLKAYKWEKLKKCALLCAVVPVICNAVDFNPFGFKRSVSDFSQILLGLNNLKYFPSETT